MSSLDHDRSSVERTLLPHVPLLRHVLRKVGVAEHDEDDAIQDCLLSAWLMLSAGRFDGSNLGAWLLTIARNVGRNYRERVGRQRIEPHAAPGVDVAVDNANPERIAEARETLARLRKLHPAHHDLLVKTAVGEFAHCRRTVARAKFRRALRVA